jgi:two-component system response regulator
MHNNNNNKRIFLIEDNIDDAELTIFAFRKSYPEIEILHLNNGVEALDFVFNAANIDYMKSVSLILLDINMPMVNGLQVLQRLKTSNTTKYIPVVMLTSSLEEKDLEESYNLGANSYLKKPVSFENFLNTVKLLENYWLRINELPLY